MKITTAELRKATDALLDHLEASGQSEVDVAEDFYGVIDVDQRYAPYASPTTFTLGQLSEDLVEIRRVVDGSGARVGWALV